MRNSPSPTPPLARCDTESSNSVGAYRFGNVGIGTYTLDATASGFQKYTKTGIVVNVAQTLEEDISFTVGSASPNRLRCRPKPCKPRRRPAKSAP